MPTVNTGGLTAQSLTVNLVGSTVTVTIGPEPQTYTFDLSKVKQLYLGKEKDVDVLIFQMLRVLLVANIDITNLALVKSTLEAATYYW